MAAIICRRVRNVVLSACIPLALYNQAQEPARHFPDTWAGQQMSQAWATSKLADSPRHGEWGQLASGSRTLKAFVIRPVIKGKVPVVIVAHEVFGLTDSTRNTADEIASMGYIAIIPDMLSGRGPNGGDVSSFADSRVTSNALTSLSDAAVHADFDAWADYARSLPDSDGTFAVVGLSWGGGAAFRYAASNRKDLKAVFVFYDVGPAAATVAKIQVPVYGFYGSMDMRVMATLESTKALMKAEGKVYDSVIYPKADHGFMRLGEDPNNGNSSNAAACQASFLRLRKLLKEVLP
jgi:carboxymethylenebutenolidase